MTSPPKLRQHLELLLTRLALVIIPPLSRRAVLLLARALGSVGYYTSIHLRRTGRTNLNIAYGRSKIPAEKRAILKQSFQTFALVLLDLFWFANRPERIKEYVRFDSSYDRFNENRPFICVSGHIGNWELLAQAVSLRGTSLVSVVAPLANPGVDAIFHKLRMQTGQTIVQKQGAIRKLLQTLKENGNVGILLDQNTKPSKGGLFVDFFGLPVPVSSAVASLHLHTQSTLLFGSCIPDKDGFYSARNLHEIELPSLVEGNKAQQVQQITQAVAAKIQQQISQSPEYWLWTYKRWKYIAPGHSPAEYPFYAKIADGG